jgi:hypothetical protein
MNAAPRSRAETRQLVAAGEARWYALRDLWQDLTVAQQVELVKTAQEMAERNQ